MINGFYKQIYINNILALVIPLKSLFLFSPFFNTLKFESVFLEFGFVDQTNRYHTLSIER